MMQYANTTNGYGNTLVASAYEIFYHSHHINTMYWVGGWVGNFFCLSTLFTLVLTARQRIESVDMIGILLVCNYGIEFYQQLSQQNVGVAIYSQLDPTQQGSLHVNLNLLLKQQITLKIKNLKIE